MTGPDPRARAWLALSDERDLWLRRLLAAERRAYDRGQQDGYEAGHRDGYAQAEAHQAEQHKLTQRLIHAAIAPTLNPEGWAGEQAADAARRVRAAEAAARRDAAWRWGEFTRRAFAERPELRSAAQQATVIETTRNQRGAA